MKTQDYQKIVHDRVERAAKIAQAGGIEQALSSGALAQQADMTLSEAIVLGLLRQGVSTFLGILGHGSTEIGEVLRVYEEAGLVKSYPMRNELEASHAAAALRWTRDVKCAVFTSIGPGALQAIAASLVCSSDGLGVWYLLGEETTEDEGPNMQQIPKDEQGLFLRVCQTMGEAYTLHTPGAVGTALRRGLNTVDNPHRGQPFYLLMPMNTQCSVLRQFNMDELPVGAPPRMGAAAGEDAYRQAAEAIARSNRVVVRLGGGAVGAGEEIAELLELSDGVAVSSPIATGAIPYEHPRNMSVGGSKGTLSGNYAMDSADLLIALGTRFVCQSDCSRTGYPNARHVVNINTDIGAATHYNKTTALAGDIAPTLRVLCEQLREHKAADPKARAAWLSDCAAKRQEWEAFKAQRYQTHCLFDDEWQREVLTQPAAIKTAVDWARDNDAVCFFDAGDVQANGFQIVEDDRPGRTFTETGASYMGFGVSALLATGIAPEGFYGLALTGDGSFTMNPQVLIDGVNHGATGCILLLDNRRMAAISGLQEAQFGVDYATNDHVEVDYVAWAKSVKGIQALHGGYSVAELQAALAKAGEHKGLTLIHVPVYFGADELGGMGVFGRWNVGNWCDEVQQMRHEIGL